MLKKMLSCLMAVLLVVGFAAPAAAQSAPRKLRIVCTIFPQYDWVRQILGGKAQDAELTLLLDNGVDLHSYQPTAGDIVKISDCDLFIYVGGESDGWVKDALAESVNKDMIALNMLEALGDSVHEEEMVEGMQAEQEEEAEEGPAYDEHVWLSLKNASTLCGAIAQALERLDPDNAAFYQANEEAYAAQLAALDGEYAAAVNGAARKTILFADRFPFRYLAEDYGLAYYAAFVGCSAETEASFETVIFLSGKVDELHLPAVLTIESSDQRIAKTVISNTREKDQKILTLDSIQSVTAKDVSEGKTYLAVMRLNLEVLKEALN